jgi:hypothetical protein
MNIPNFQSSKFVDSNGYLTNEWQLIMQQLIQALQQNLSNEGYKLPQQSAANIATLNTTDSTGNLIYDSTNNVAKVNLNGTYVTITTSV